MSRVVIAICLLLLTTTNVLAEDFLTDSFESGDLTSPGGTTGSWGAEGHGTNDDVEVSNDTARTGSYSLKFTFYGDYTETPPQEDAFAEQNFNIGTSVQELWVMFYLYWPSGFAMPSSASPTNNKFLMVWSSEGQTSSLFYDLEYFNSTTPTFLPKCAGNGTINTCAVTSASDIRPYTATTQAMDTSTGAWRKYKMHMRVDTGTGDGFYRLWEDGTLVYENEDITSTDAPCDDGYLVAGYLLGWANSGFESTQIIYLDDITISDSDPDGGGDTTQHSGMVSSGGLILE